MKKDRYHKSKRPKRKMIDLRTPGTVCEADAQLKTLTHQFRMLRQRATQIAKIYEVANTTADLESDSVRNFIPRLPFYRQEATAYYTRLAERIMILIRERIFLVVQEDRLSGKLNLPNRRRSFADPQLLQDPIIGPLALKDVFRYASGQRIQNKDAILFYLLLVGKGQTENQIKHALMLGRSTESEILNRPDRLKKLLTTSRYFEERNGLWHVGSLTHIPRGFHTWLSEGPISHPVTRKKDLANLLNIQICIKRQQTRIADAPTKGLLKHGRPTKELALEVIAWLAARGADVATIAYLLDSSRNTINKHALEIIQRQRYKPNFKIGGRVKKHLQPKLIQDLTALGLSVRKVAALLKTSRNKLDLLATHDEEIRHALYIGRQYARCRRQNIERPTTPIDVPPKLVRTKYHPNFRIVSPYKGKHGRPPATINATLLEALLARGLPLTKVAKILKTNRGVILRQALSNPTIRDAMNAGRVKGGTVTRAGGLRTTANQHKNAAA